MKWALKPPILFGVLKFLHKPQLWECWFIDSWDKFCSLLLSLTGSWLVRLKAAFPAMEVGGVSPQRRRPEVLMENMDGGMNQCQSDSSKMWNIWLVVVGFSGGWNERVVLILEHLPASLSHLMKTILKGWSGTCIDGGGSGTVQAWIGLRWGELSRGW